MSCNKDNRCRKIANNYASSSGNINNNFNDINLTVNEVIESLNSLNIPGDYVGEKTMEAIKTINGNLNSNLEEVNGSKENINNFINEKIKEHNRHYRDWCDEQDKLKPAKKEESIK